MSDGGSGSPGAATDLGAYLNELIAERDKQICSGHAARLLDQGKAYSRTKVEIFYIPRVTTMAIWGCSR